MRSRDGLVGCGVALDVPHGVLLLLEGWVVADEGRVEHHDVAAGRLLLNRRNDVEAIRCALKLHLRNAWIPGDVALGAAVVLLAVVSHLLLRPVINVDVLAAVSMRVVRRVQPQHKLRRVHIVLLMELLEVLLVAELVGPPPLHPVEARPEQSREVVRHLGDALGLDDGSEKRVLAEEGGGEGQRVVARRRLLHQLNVILLPRLTAILHDCMSRRIRFVALCPPLIEVAQDNSLWVGSHLFLRWHLHPFKIAQTVLNRCLLALLMKLPYLLLVAKFDVPIPLIPEEAPPR
mmetsp:Transcript_59880/g.122885  ORF Transcript_59880/g.122885 Transcript_59880/m.122885 type:complete len:290 (+) Transcript_59880:372-1241(+)